MKILWYFLLIIPFVMVACGGDDGGSGSGSQNQDIPVPQTEFPQPQPPVVTIPPTEIDNVMNNQNFSCASINGGACPSGVARLFIGKSIDQWGLCSGFMVDSTTLITNSHCTINSQEQCNNTQIAVYNGNSYTRTKCQSIVRDASEGDPKKIDVTVIKVQTPFNGRTFDISDDRAEVGDELTAWVVDHTGSDAGINLLDSRITEFRCRAIYMSNDAPLIMNFCPIVAGNSGSPLLNSRRDLVGIIWGGQRTFMEVNNSTMNLEERRNSDVFGFATEMIYFFQSNPPTDDGSTTGDTGTTTTGDTGTTTGDTGTTTGDTGTTTGDTGTTTGDTGTTTGETGTTTGETGTTTGETGTTTGETGTATTGI